MGETMRTPQAANDRGRIARPVRRQASHLVHQCLGDVGERNHRFQAQDGPQSLRPEAVVGVANERFLQGRQMFGGHGQPGGVTMPAELLQPFGAVLQAAIQVERRDAPSGTSGDAVVDLQQKRRAVIMFGDAGSHDAHHPQMPIRMAQHDSRRGRAAIQLSDAFVHRLLDVTLQRAALLVHVIEQSRQTLGLCRSRAMSNPRLCAADPSRPLALSRGAN